MASGDRPQAYAAVSTVSPNARATPTKPIPSPGNEAATTALSQPPRTSQHVPRNSLVIFPGYADYLFIAFTNSFAFSPTDALPLTQTAKMLMLLQAAISVVIVLGIAGGAINAVMGA